MTLALDPRQRAMLDEMGVKVWWPNSVPAEAEAEAEVLHAIAPVARHVDTGVETAVATERAAIQPPVSRPTASARATTSPAPSAPAANATASPAAPQAHAVLLESPQRLYDGTGPAQGGWLIVADMAPEPDGQHGAPFAGDAGRLLDNMLRALQLHRGERPVHLMRTHRGSPRTAGAENAYSSFAENFAAKAGALSPRVVLAMGPLAAQALFDSTEPLGKLRGRAIAPASLPGASLIATYPPAYLLRNPADKARAWADLCLAAAKMDEVLT